MPSLRSIKPEDLLDFKYLNDPQISPDGQTIAYTVTKIVNGKYRSEIWVVDTLTAQHTCLLGGDGYYSIPRWSPDKEVLAYISDSSGKPELWTIELKTRDTRLLCDHLTGLFKPTWSPDGSKIAGIAMVEESEGGYRLSTGVHIIKRLLYKRDTIGLTHERRRHLFVIPVEGGEVEQLTNGPMDVDDFTWSPDGTRLAYVSAPISGDSDESMARALWVVGLTGDMPVSLVDHSGPISTPSWSPDGKNIAYVGAEEAWGFRNAHLWVLKLGVAKRCLTHHFDRYVGNDRVISDCVLGQTLQGPVWSGDSSTIYFCANEGGETAIYTVDETGGPVSRLYATSSRNMINFTYSALTNRFACAISTPHNPCDLWMWSNEQQFVQLTQVNEDVLNEIYLAEPESIRLVASDGVQIEGWLLKPQGFSPHNRYPLILNIHGGPHRAFGHSFFQELQLLAGQGYLVLYTNPRGSVGYGENFSRNIMGAWGGRDYLDLMEMLNLVAAFEYVDEQRLGVCGGSYGGYMTNWIIGHNKRFSVAITDRCTSNLYSFYGTSEGGILFQEPIFGTTWENEELLMDRSPIRYVEKISTPLLIIHSEFDFTCPIEQAEQLFTALKRLGRDVVFARFPSTGHELSRSGPPELRVERFNLYIGWFGKFLTDSPADYYFRKKSNKKEEEKGNEI